MQGGRGARQGAAGVLLYEYASQSQLKSLIVCVTCGRMLEWRWAGHPVWVSLGVNRCGVARARGGGIWTLALSHQLLAHWTCVCVCVCVCV